VKAISTEKTKVGGGGGYTYTFWIRPNGKVRARITNDNRSWRGEGIAGAKATIGETITAMDVDRIVDVWRGKLTSDVTAPPTLLDQRVRESRRGVVRTRLTTRHDGSEVAALDVQIADADTGKAVLDTVVASPDAVDRTYYSPVEFEDVPDGETYLVLIDLLDGEGVPVGDQLEVELTAPVTSTDEVTVAGVFLSEARTSSLTLWHHPTDGYALALEYDGADVSTVASAEISFEEPFEGPPPLEATVALPLLVERAHWKVKGTTSLPDTFTVTTTLLDAADAPLSVVQSGGYDPGITYKDDESKDEKEKKKKPKRGGLKRIVVMKPLDCSLCGWASPD